MSGVLGWIRRFIRELRRRRVIRVAVVYATTAFVVLQLGELLLEPFGLGDWALRLIILLLVLGFPLATGLAWVYNITEEGLVRRQEGREAATEIDPESKPLTSDGLIVGLLVIAIGLLLYPRVFSSEESSGQASSTTPDTAQIGERSIAVLPFEALGQEKPGVFTEGMHDDLLTRLSNVSDLKVISRTAVQQFRDTELTTARIADSLGVRWVLEGGVQEMGDRIQVNAQLIDPRTESHVWAEDYQRDLAAEDLFAIQGDITEEIADALKARLTAGEQERIAGALTDNLEAYRFYAEARRLLDQNSLSEAAVELRKALREDSTFALAWAGLADVLGGGAMGGSYQPDSLKLPDVTQMEAARRAVQLAPDLGEARAALGHAHLEARNAPAALQEARRAVELKPSYAQAHQLLGTVLQVIGRFEEGLRHFQIAEGLNPHHLGARHRLFDALMWAGKFQRALTEVRQQRKMYGYSGTSWAEIRALRGLGCHDEAIDLTQKRLKKADGALEQLILHSYLVGLKSETGDTTEAQGHLAEMQEISVSSEQRRRWSWIYVSAQAHLENFDAAFQEIRLEEWDSVVPSIGLRREDNPLRKDPRYEELIRTVNRHWNLNPDGSLPEDADVPTSPTDR